jgi:hypothetical protein
LRQGLAKFSPDTRSSPNQPHFGDGGAT